MNRLALSAALLAALPVRAQLPAPEDPLGFALSLQRAVADGRNLLLSPYSARQCLGMVYAGAEGPTRAGMAKALGAGHDFLDAERRRREQVSAPDEAEVRAANAVFMKKGYALLPSFRDSVQSVFERKFGPSALAELNGWVRKRTAGRIPSILKSLEPDDRVVLLNAVYFKGRWRKPFPKETEAGRRRGGGEAGGPYPATFTPGAGEPFATKLMPRQAASADYAEGQGWQAVSLPYKGRWSFLAVLPARGSSLQALREGLNAGAWRRLHEELRPRPGLVALPRFKFQGDYELGKPLSAMGMSLAFDRSRADFSRMARPGKRAEELFLSRVLQKTFIELDEEGTTAAAATAAVMGVRGSAARREEPFEFVADRPFLFAIEDRLTGTVLFLGELHDPRKG